MEIRKQELATLPLIHEGNTSLLYLKEKSNYGKPVVIKLLRQVYSPLREILRLANEFKLTEDLDIPGIRRAFEEITIDGRPGLILEYMEGETLREALIKGRWTLKEILSISISIAATLHDIHHQKIIHRNISSTNIIVNRQQQTATIIDFGMAMPEDLQTGQVESPEVFEESLPYISPEQTGRINRSVDHRSDLYALGVVLYEMLTGKLPFDTAKPAELIHCHIAKNPTPVVEINPEIPAVVSDIVMKLMAKNAEDRYQSAYGLKVDLENCLLQLNNTGVIEAFELAGEDFPGVFQVSQKLYGREQEFQILLEAVENVSHGAAEVLLVSGNAGVGKSALVNEIQRVVVEKGGYFIAGKHEVYQRRAPYPALIQAVSRLVDLMLMESAEQLARWNTTITQALGVNGALLIEVIPRLELIMGRQPPVPKLEPAEGQVLFHHMFKNLIQVIAQKQHPLVLFIDNLQWADVASLNLLRFLITGGETRYLLVIGSYRDNEVAPSHQLMTTVEALKQLKTPVKTIHLENLSSDSLNQLVSDTLKCDSSQAQSISNLIYEKTGGNPLFAKKFFQSLPEEGFLTFDADMRRWKWDIEQIRKKDITDNVATLMTQEIGKLPPKTQELLALAACVGERFDLKNLAAVAGQSQMDTFAHLGKAMEKGLVLPLDESYQLIMALKEPQAEIESYFQFLHDRVRQASYALLSKKYRKAVSLKVGRITLQNTQGAELDEKLFDIADHFNEGFQFLQDEQEKLRAIDLNLMAGRKAKRAAAYQAAIWYLSMGIGMLPVDKWERHYNLTLNLYMEAIEAEYLSTNFERAELLATEVLQHVKDPFTRIKVYEFRVLVYTAQNQNAAAIKAGLMALDLLEVHLPREPEEIKASAAEMRKELSEEIRRIEDLAYLPIMEEEHQLAVMRILMNLAAPAHQVNPLLLSVVISKMIQISIQGGNSPMAAFAYGWHAVLLCGAYGEVEQGYRFGQLSLKVLEQFNAPELEGKIVFLFNVCVRPWKEHAREVLKPLLEVYQAGMAMGGLEYPYYCAVHYCSYLLCTGGPLEYIRQKQGEYLETLGRYRLESQSYFGRVWGQMVLNLLGDSKDPGRLRGELLDEEKMLPLWMEQNNLVLVFSTLCCRTMLQYLFGNYAEAIASARLGEEYEKGGEGYIYLVELNFYQALALLANYPEADDQAKKEYLHKVASIQERMKHWAYHAPMNYQHKFDLIEAERMRQTGETLKAMELYGQAIKGAREQGYIQEEALAYEREAEFHLALGREDFAGLCLKKASDGYRYWGATQKVADLENRYKYLLAKEKPASLDTAAIITASHMLSQEIHLEQLLDRMMHLVIENAGAEKGILIEIKDDKLIVQAKGEIGREQVETMQQLPIEQSGEVPLSIVNYVARTQTPVVLNDAVHDRTYVADKYISEHQTKSLLCLPIVHYGKLSGLLYLENNLATNVFTPDRLELLQTLSSQAAISMENARLYANLEKNIKELQQAEETLTRHRDHLEELVEERTVEVTTANELLRQEIAERKIIEEALNRRLVALTEPLETADISFADLFNLEEIQKIQDAFAEAHHVASIITHPDGSPITKPSNFCRLCSEIIRRTEKGLANCFYSDSIIGRQNPEGPIIQPCLSGGLWDAGANITLGGKHIANWLIGQVKNEAIDEEKLIQYAGEIGADEEEFRQALQEVPVLSNEQFRKVADVLFLLTNELSLKAYQNVQQARFITERRHAEEELQKAHDVLEQRVEERTAELREVNEQLAQEIGERKRAEEEITSAHRRLDSTLKFITSVISAIPIPLFYKDREGRYMGVNEAFAELLGFTPDYYKGKTVMELWPREFAEIYHKADLELMSHPEKQVYEYKVLDKNGVVHPALWGKNVFRDENGEVAGIVGAFYDITERVRAEEALQETMERLRRSNQELEEFAYVASHDLQEPLRAVASFTQLLAENYQGQLDAEADEFIGFIVDGAKRMQRLINDLLAYSRVRTKGVPFEATDFEEVLSQALVNLEAAIEENQAVITHDPLPTILADKQQMMQLLQNLIGNAIKFRSAELPCIHVAAECRDNEWVFAVKDNGIGIDPQFQEQIFVIFQRLHDREEYPGTGIGLAICKRVVERHGGRIWVESVPEKGSIFYFTIPALPNT